MGAALAGLVLGGWLIATGPAVAEVLLAGPKGAGASLEAVLQQAKDGDTIELLPGSYTGQYLMLDQRRLTIKSAGGKVVFDGQGKVTAADALWTVSGGDVVVENIEFRGARARRADGAGIRLNSGRLTVRDCTFFDNEHGIVTGNDEAAELVIESTQFGLAPKVEGGLYHLINVGRIGRFSVSGSRFQQGFEGHLIRSRARESLIAYNFVHDGLRGGASYEIDLAVGGLATVIGNVIAQGADSQNRVVLAYGGEGRAWERNQLRVAHNTFINYKWSPAWFLRVFRDRLPEDTTVVAVNNLLVGPGIFSFGASGYFEGNYPATLAMLVDPETYAFELPADSLWRGRAVDARSIGGNDLTPKAEFQQPRGVRMLPAGLRSWTPGAFQK